MTPEILSWLRSAKRRFVPANLDILEVGSYNINGTPREVFEADSATYLGIDRQDGPGVDANDMPDRKFDTVICCECLEHDADPLATVRAMRERLKPGGLLIITTPYNGFGEHFFPRDYWRFMKNAYEDLFFAGMEIIELVEVLGPTLCGIARLRPDV